MRRIICICIRNLTDVTIDTIVCTSKHAQTTQDNRLDWDPSWGCACSERMGGHPAGPIVVQEGAHMQRLPSGVPGFGVSVLPGLRMYCC